MLFVAADQLVALFWCEESLELLGVLIVMVDEFEPGGSQDVWRISGVEIGSLEDMITPSFQYKVLA